MKKTTRLLTCIDDRCFTSEYDACKFLMQLACERRKVNIRHIRVE
jgi:hypothetical protein